MVEHHRANGQLAIGEASLAQNPGERAPLLASDPEQQQSSKPKKSIFAIGVVGVAILYYAACSSTMLVINKVAIYYIPAPTSVLVIQLLCTVLFVKGADAAGILQADKLEWDKFVKFFWVIAGFVGTIYANIKVLQHANVETFITFRSSTPLVMSFMDYLFLGRALPSMRSWGCLVVLVSGSVGYVLTDSGFEITAYAWLAVWYACFTFDTTYVKHVCESVKMTNWGRVYYTNFITIFFLAPVIPILQEHKTLAKVDWNLAAIFPLVLSCVVGTCMSHSSYLLRDTVSATLFTVVGIVCKLLSVLLNILIWDKHATPTGIAFLMVCVLAGTFYEQAPKRSEVKARAQEQSASAKP